MRMRIRGILHLPLVFMNVYDYKMYLIEYLDLNQNWIFKIVLECVIMKYCGNFLLETYCSITYRYMRKNFIL